MAIINITFITAAFIIVTVGVIIEKHIEDESWGKKKRFRQMVEMNYEKLIIRHRTPYAEIGAHVVVRR